MAELAGLVLAAPGVIVLVFDLGHRVWTSIDNDREFEDLLPEIQEFEVDDKKEQLKLSLILAQEILRSPAIEEEAKARLNRNFERISHLLIRANNLIGQVKASNSFVSRWKTHGAKKELRDMGSTKKISTAIMEFHNVVMGLRTLDAGNSPKFLAHHDFTPIDPTNRSFGPNEDVFLCQGRLTMALPGVDTNRRWFLFERKQFSAETKEYVKQDIRTLAQKLDKAQPNSGVLRILGFRENLDNQATAFELVFHGNFDGNFPRTLANAYDTENPAPSLNYRISLCHKLATAVLQTHTMGLVHKNIRPNNIILTKSANSIEEDNVPTVSLVGWQHARNVQKAVTHFHGETSVEKKVYQHPHRQMPMADREYTMADDVYSLGVCMLEVINWEPLLSSNITNNGEAPTSVSGTFLAAFQELEPNVTQDVAMRRLKSRPKRVQEALILMSKTVIPRVAGRKISHLITKFLTDLDDMDQTEFMEREERSAQTVAMGFVDTALKDIGDIQSVI